MLGFEQATSYVIASIHERRDENRWELQQAAARTGAYMIGQRGVNWAAAWYAGGITDRVLLRGPDQHLTRLRDQQTGQIAQAVLAG